jgi:hypothetical protein
MDESERLIARAALGSPAEAVGLWQQWRETYDPATASDLLVWAGGYVHRNIVAAGSRDEYLAGIARYNWVANQRQLLAAHDDLVELAALHPLVTLKSFDASRADGALSLRPVADIDLYVDARRVERVVGWLRERGYRALLDVSDFELFERIVPLRGSWNFTRTAGETGVEAGIDVHWKLFDALTVPVNRRFARRWTIPADASFGALRALTPEARFALLAVQRLAQQDDKETALFDAGHLVGELTPQKLVAVARASRSHASVVTLLERLGEFSSSPRIAELREAVFDDMQTGRGGANRYEARLPPVDMPRRTGAMPLTSSETVIAARDDLPFGTRWFHVFPGDTWRWTMVSEARLVFGVGADAHATNDAEPTAANFTIRLNQQAWAVCSAQHLDVVCNGQLVGNITKDITELTVTVPLGRRRRTLDLRIRGTGADLPASDPRSLVFNRIVAPVEEIRISLTSR